MSKYLETKIQKQNNSSYPYVFIIALFGCFSTGSPSSKYEYPRASALLHGAKIRILFSRGETIFYERAQQVSEMLFLPRENKIHIFAPR